MDDDLCATSCKSGLPAAPVCFVGYTDNSVMLATNGYKKNTDSPVGNELDLKEGYTLVYFMKHDDNENWWLAEEGKRMATCHRPIS